MTTIKKAALADTISALFSSGKGVLVLDRYSEASAIDSRPGAVDLDRFLTMALTAPALDEVVSTVLLTLDGLRSTTKLRATTGFARHVNTGVCLDADSVTTDVLNEALGAGAAFVELRANLTPGRVGPGEPATRAHVLARGARDAQDAGLVPILTFAMPDLGTQSLKVTFAATANALRGLVTACEFQGVELSEMIIRTNMVAPGSDALHQADPADVGTATVAVLSDHLPASVGGVLLLSGGLELSRACSYLASVKTASAEQQSPWPISFGFARPLVASATQHWDGSSTSPVARMAVTSACRLAADALTTGGVA